MATKMMCMMLNPPLMTFCREATPPAWRQHGTSRQQLFRHHSPLPGCASTRARGLSREAGTVCAGQEQGVMRHNTIHVKP